MPSTVSAPEGYEAIPGRTSQKATALLEAARKVGVDVTLIRTVPSRDEYHVPEEVAKEYMKNPVKPEDEGFLNSAEPWAPLGELRQAQADAAVDADGSAHPPTGEDAKVKKPGINAAKTEWVEYARTLGYDPGEKDLTKNELVEKYGSDD